MFNRRALLKTAGLTAPIISFVSLVPSVKADEEQPVEEKILEFFVMTDNDIEKSSNIQYKIQSGLNRNNNMIEVTFPKGNYRISSSSNNNSIVDYVVNEQITEGETRYFANLEHRTLCIQELPSINKENDNVE